MVAAHAHEFDARLHSPHETLELAQAAFVATRVCVGVLALSQLLAADVGWKVVRKVSAHAEEARLRSQRYGSFVSLELPFDVGFGIARFAGDF